ncbi:Hypothetical predicted protein, partial [Pelobates cultripes]
MPTSIRCVSINAKGLISSNMRHSILRWAHKQNADILLIQETHFPTHRKFPLTNRYYMRSFMAPSLDTKSKGVAIVLKANSPLTGITCTKDPQGRYISIQGNIGTKTYTFSS